MGRTKHDYQVKSTRCGTLDGYVTKKRRHGELSGYEMPNYGLDPFDNRPVYETKQYSGWKQNNTTNITRVRTSPHFKNRYFPISRSRKILERSFDRSSPFRPSHSERSFSSSSSHTSYSSGSKSTPTSGSRTPLSRPVFSSKSMKSTVSKVVWSSSPPRSVDKIALTSTPAGPSMSPKLAPLPVSRIKSSTSKAFEKDGFEADYQEDSSIKENINPCNDSQKQLLCRKRLWEVDKDNESRKSKSLQGALESMSKTNNDMNGQLDLDAEWNCKTAVDNQSTQIIDLHTPPLEWPTVDDRPLLAGLQNLGNTCYMNAAIQCLMSVERFTSYFERPKANSELVTGLSQLVNTVNSANLSHDSSVKPQDFLETVGRHFDNFVIGQQQDAQEFLVVLFQKLHAELNQQAEVSESPMRHELSTLSFDDEVDRFWQRHLADNRSIITRLFDGLQCRIVKCNNCGGVTKTPEVFRFLPVSVPAEPALLTHCLNQIQQPEMLTGQSEFECPKCQTKSEAESRNVIYRTPQYLLIHLKRFAFDKSVGLLNKLETLIDYPLDDLQVEARVSSERRFQLLGAVNHQGWLDGGHYTALVKHPNDGRWYKFDDQHVSAVSNYDDIVSSDAYILFYAANN